MKALLGKKMWGIVDILENTDQEHSSWFKMVYTIKHKFDGFIEKYKARLVTKGFNQMYRVNYLGCKDKPYQKYTSLDSFKGVGHVSVRCKECVLNDDLEEEVYMSMPLAYEEIEKYCN